MPSWLTVLTEATAPIAPIKNKFAVSVFGERAMKFGAEAPELQTGVRTALGLSELSPLDLDSFTKGRPPILKVAPLDRLDVFKVESLFRRAHPVAQT